MALSIDDLRSFLLVASERSVTKAAEQLGVSQQSVSERIRRLENRIGVRLFDRIAYGMQPSTAGFRFLPYASQCVALIDRAMAVIDDEEFVRISVQRSVAPAVLPILDSLTAADHLNRSVVEEAEAIISALGSGSADVGIGVFPESLGVKPAADGPSAGRTVGGEVPVGPGVPGAAVNGSGTHPDGGDSGDANGSSGSAAFEVVTKALFSDPVVWAVLPGHPLAQRTQPLSMVEVVGLPATADPADGSDADGVRVAPRSVLSADIASGRLVELPLDQPSWVVPVSIAYRATEHDRPAIAAIRDALVEGHSRSSARSISQPSQ